MKYVSKRNIQNYIQCHLVNNQIIKLQLCENVGLFIHLIKVAVLKHKYKFSIFPSNLCQSCAFQNSRCRCCELSRIILIPVGACFCPLVLSSSILTVLIDPRHSLRQPAPASCILHRFAALASHRIHERQAIAILSRLYKREKSNARYCPMVSIYSELFAHLLFASIRLRIATKMHR